jgi:hypothetical protein
LLVRRDAGEFFPQPLVKQRAVRQIGQRVVMSQMPDLFFRAPALGDVLVGCDPSAAGDGLVDDQDRPPIGVLVW